MEMGGGHNQKRLNYLHNLVAIANADGKICKREVSFLKDEASRLGIQPEYIDYISSVAYATVFTPPDSITERVEYLEKCVLMALVDGVLYKEELALCLKVCVMLNVDRSMLEEIISFNQIKILADVKIRS